MGQLFRSEKSKYDNCKGGKSLLPKLPRYTLLPNSQSGLWVLFEFEII